MCCTKQGGFLLVLLPSLYKGWGVVKIHDRIPSLCLSKNDSIDYNSRKLFNSQFYFQTLNPTIFQTEYTNSRSHIKLERHDRNIVVFNCLNVGFDLRR
jgi:hypothetical protein